MPSFSYRNDIFINFEYGEEAQVVRLDDGRFIVIYATDTDDGIAAPVGRDLICLLYTSPSPRDRTRARMPSSA